MEPPPKEYFLKIAFCILPWFNILSKINFCISISILQNRKDPFKKLNPFGFFMFHPSFEWHLLSQSLGIGSSGRFGVLPTLTRTDGCCRGHLSGACVRAKLCMSFVHLYCRTNPGFQSAVGHHSSESNPRLLPIAAVSLEPFLLIGKRGRDGNQLAHFQIPLAWHWGIVLCSL